MCGEIKTKNVLYAWRENLDSENSSNSYNSCKRQLIEVFPQCDRKPITSYNLTNNELQGAVLAYQ
jgi:hypothetical protein